MNVQNHCLRNECRVLISVFQYFQNYKSEKVFVIFKQRFLSKKNDGQIQEWAPNFTVLSITFPALILKVTCSNPVLTFQWLPQSIKQIKGKHRKLGHSHFIAGFFDVITY
jgi:hypothetical protein